MPIGAVSLRTNNDYKVTANKAQSFGRRDDSDGLKNRKAAGIAISVGLFAATAITLYVFRGKIASLPLFKNLSEKGQKVVEKANDFAQDLGEKGKKIVKGATDIAKDIGEKAKNVVDDASEMAKKAGDEFKELGKKGKKLADEAIDAIEKTAREVVKKGKKNIKK